MKKTFSNSAFKAITLSFIFLVSGISTPVILSASAAANKGAGPLPMATPLSQAEASWGWPNGNQFAQDYNPQKQINASNVQNLGLAWLLPLPIRPTPLTDVRGGLGVDTAPLIINGTIYFVTQGGQAFALNAANGNVIWSTILPLSPNSTAGKGIGSISLHLHDGDVQFTSKLFSNTPAFWISAPDQHVYVLNAVNGKNLLNWSIFDGVKTIDGNNPSAVYTGTPANILVDQSRAIAITSLMSGSSAATGRCFYRGWDLTASPPKLMWTAFCTPPQPGGNLSVDPSWEIKQVNSMKAAQIFYPGPAYNNGGAIPGTAVVDLKKLPTSQLNATLYNDWGYVNKSPFCAGIYTGSTGSTVAGWGSSWVLGTGPTAGLAFVNTNNKDPYNSPCSPGPNLWSAAVLALNETSGNWVWGFQSTAHDMWDYDCSWWQALGNETISGVSTQVLFKTCKSGYLFELNAQNGNLIWAWTAPQSVIPRCSSCYMLDPTNATQMNQPFFNPSLKDMLCNPCTFGFESEAAFDPTTNYIYVVSQNQPRIGHYVLPNTTNWAKISGTDYYPPPGQTVVRGPFNNATAEAIDASTGQQVWSYLIPHQGYRGGQTASGGVLYLTLSSGDILMLNDKTGALIKDYFVGGPLNVIPSIGATVDGQMQVVFPITAGLVTWGTEIPGDIVALRLLPTAASGTTTVTSPVVSTSTTTVGAGGAGAATVTTTVATTVTASGGGIDPTITYGIAAVAVIAIIAAGFFAMRGRRRPAP